MWGSELFSLANNRMDYCHSSLSASPLLPVFVFLRSPLDLAALVINWFSHLVSAFWGMTATACPFCRIHPHPTTAGERSAKAPCICRGRESGLWCSAAEGDWTGLWWPYAPSSSVISAHLQPTCTNSGEMGLKRGSGQMAWMQKGDCCWRSLKKERNGGMVIWRGRCRGGGVPVRKWKEWLRGRMIYKMPFEDVINQPFLSVAERKEIKMVIKDEEDGKA